MRINTVDCARKSKFSRRCEKCGAEIEPGMTYRYIEPRYGPKRYRCGDCPRWRPSEMTGSKLATAMAGQEDAADALGALDLYVDADDVDSVVDDIRSILDDCAQTGDDCRDDYQDGFDNIPYNLQEGDVAQQIQEKIDALERWADDLRSFSPDAFGDDETPPNEYLESVVNDAQDLVDGLEA